MRRTLIIALIVLLASTGCNKNQETKTELPSNGVKQTSAEQETLVSEDIVIDEEFLKERYPEKKILTWVYGETWKYTQEDIDKGCDKYGLKCMSNNQIVKLNDYLDSKGKDYVINYVKLGGGTEYLNEVKKMVEEGNSPDFMSVGEYYDFTAEVVSYALTYDFIREELFEDLTPYLETELKDYSNAVPENALEGSKVNGKLYGIDSNIYASIYSSYDWYVNADVAEEYGIDLESMDTMSLEDWLKYCDIVYEGEKKKETPNFKILQMRGIYTDEFPALGYIGELNGGNIFKTEVFGFEPDGDEIINYYADPEVKQRYKVIFEYTKKGYRDYLNPVEGVTGDIAEGNVFLYLYECRRESKEAVQEKIQVGYCDANSLKKISWKKGGLDQAFRGVPVISGICSASNNKESALDALNLIYSDREISNIIANPYYEIGSDKVMLDEDVEKAYYSYSGEGNLEAPSGGMVNTMLVDSIVESGIDYETDEQSLVDNVEFNEKLYDNLYDYTPIEKEVRALRKVENKYIGVLGLRKKYAKEDFEEVWAKFLEELDDAGMEKALKYLNQQ